MYLPRLEIYAENLSEYRERRKLFDDYGIEIPLKLVRCGDLMVIYSYAHEQKSLMNYVVEKVMIGSCQKFWNDCGVRFLCKKMMFF